MCRCMSLPFVGVEAVEPGVFVIVPEPDLAPEDGVMGLEEEEGFLVGVVG